MAYLDCASGISGDMTVAALIDLGVELPMLQEAIDSLRLPNVVLHVTEVQRCGFRAKHFRVEHPEQHAHRHLSDIIQILDRSPTLTEVQRELALKMFRKIAEAEAKVHGSTIDEIHFHEVGAIDSIVDIICTAVGFDVLDVEEIVCSPLPPGRGTVQIAHGTCPVPTPGTLEILRGMPLADVPVDGELTTPTGAAIAATLVDRFVTSWPAFTPELTGCGAGTKDFPDHANILRIAVGTQDVDPLMDEVVLLETNLDDCSPEVLGYTKRRLLATGALDVYTTPIQMKKDRPGSMLCVICRPEQVAEMEAILFTETTTLGIRRQKLRRSLRQRTSFNIDTPWGPVAGKVAWRPGEPALFSPEYDDCVQIAEAYSVPLREVMQTAQAEFLVNVDLDDEEAASLCDHDHDADDDHDHSHDDDDEGHAHDHSHDHGHDHGHDHSHDKPHDHGHDHHHDHHHG